MRIAFLAPAWPAAAAHNGIATYVDIMSRALRRQGHDTLILASKIIGECDGDVIETGEPDNPVFAGWMAKARSALRGDDTIDTRYWGAALAATLSRASRHQPIDLFEIEESFGVARYCQGRIGTPVAIRSHGPHRFVVSPPFGPSDERRIREEGRAFFSAGAVNAPSKALLSAIEESYGERLGRAGVFPNPIELPDARDCWSLDESDPNELLFVGRFDAVKGADLAIEAFTSLAAERKNLRLTFVGLDRGLRNASGELVRFADYAARNVPDAVRRRIDFRGPVRRDELQSLRRRAALCISASRYETFPYAVIEALALGAPVVATKTMGLAEYLEDDREIAFTAIGDAAALSRRIADLLDNPHYRAAMGAQARSTAAQRFAADRVVTQALAFYQDVAATQKTAKARAS
ncbi:MAG: glycosyltransferase family 4 protein [Pseudomonadota bacterium]